MLSGREVMDCPIVRGRKELPMKLQHKYLKILMWEKLERMVLEKWMDDGISIY